MQSNRPQQQQQQASAEGAPERGPQPRAPKEVGRGVVKQVLSGDKVVIYCDPRRGQAAPAVWTPPEEKEIKLSNIKAPLPYAKWAKGEREEEPFAWHSKDFLRKYAVGKPVEYTIEYAPTTGTTRLYGTVVLTKPEQGEEADLAKAAVAAGWATVSSPAPKESSQAVDSTKEVRVDPRSETVRALIDLQNAAKDAELGLHTTDKAKLDKSRVWVEKPLKSEDDDTQDESGRVVGFDATEMYKSIRNKTLNAIVEYVHNGSTMRVLLLPSLREVMLKIAGVQSPLIRRNPTPDEPFAREAQFTTERYLLQRDVSITFNAFDPADARGEATFYGEVIIKTKSIGELLLDSGLARVVDWTAPASKTNHLYTLQETAQKQRRNMWSEPSAVNTQRQAGAQSITGPRSYSGKVVEVTSASTLVVQVGGERTGPAGGATTVTPVSYISVTLSSITVPRLGHGDRDDEFFAFEAREWVRKRTIGKRVMVTTDYVRPAHVVREDKQGNPSPTGAEKTLPAKAFHTVIADGKNLALGLIDLGYATIIPRGEERSPHFDELSMAQGVAKNKKVGLWGNPANFPRHRVNDISRNAQNAKKLLKGFETREGHRHKGIVEYVISGSRVKIYLPSQTSLITFFLSGARCNPIPTKAQLETGKETPLCAAEARDFTRSQILHHDVEITIDGQDQSGAFRGHLFFKKQSLGLQLLQKGYAQLSRMNRDSDSNDLEPSYKAAEQAAKDERIGIWINYDPEVERLAAEERAKAQNTELEALSKPRRELVQVTEVIDASVFYYQSITDAQKRLEDEIMKGLQEEGLNGERPFTAAKKNDVVACRFSDNKWYRGVVRSVQDGKFKIFYVDYGNTEMVPASELRQLKNTYSEQALPFQARAGTLAYLQVHPLSDEWGTEAAYHFRELVWGKTLLATVEYTEGEVSALSLITSDESKAFVNGDLVRAGLAKLVRRIPRGANYELIDWLRAEQDEAHAKHAGIWEYGDAGDDDDEKH
eukprot:TRINITY_DN3518_c0_g1_i1.p1 TRINITY_DN3518_c0_g1~~TRINITY_DN3518_c0_g1_i1.p1  ORF type:complete len:1031 (+),score=206.74 TRINITY_DN3518_c0_g1_i1:113-3094(+)